MFWKNLLVLNLSVPDAMRKLCEFLGHRVPDLAMPHENRSV